MERNYIECGNIATTEQVEDNRYYRYSIDSLLFIAGVTEIEQKIGHRLSVISLDECENRNEPAFIAHHNGEYTLFVAADSDLLNRMKSLIVKKHCGKSKRKPCINSVSNICPRSR